MIPTHHTVDVIKAGESDVWGNVKPAETWTLPCNIRSQEKVVTDTNGEEVVSKYTVLFIGVVNINRNDVIRFTEPNGLIVEQEPVTVKFMRDLDGSVGFTKAVL